MGSLKRSILIVAVGDGIIILAFTIISVSVGEPREYTVVSLGMFILLEAANVVFATGSRSGQKDDPRFESDSPKFWILTTAFTTYLVVLGCTFARILSIVGIICLAIRTVIFYLAVTLIYVKPRESRRNEETESQFYRAESFDRLEESNADPEYATEARLQNGIRSTQIVQDEQRLPASEIDFQFDFDSTADIVTDGASSSELTPSSRETVQRNDIRERSSLLTLPPAYSFTDLQSVTVCHTNSETPPPSYAELRFT